ncbi:MAG TPA: DUF1343 domain-containing protein [Polyangia bacterium]|nr:DUF1343 domain-containing protein [Polyangia bacterium]
MTVESGLDVLCTDRLSLLRGRRVGVLCHPASVASDLTHAVDRLIEAGVRPKRLYGPEHGVRGEAQDMIGVDDDHDRRTGIPVVSLYGETFESLAPSAADLADIDVLVVDLQDVGSRYYTYIWTMVLALEAAFKAGVAVIVLDRPNPLGGLAIEGGTVGEAYESFVGLGAIPVRHGLTIGEVARLRLPGMPWGGARFARPIEGDLTVVPMRGWRRAMNFVEAGLPWVMPSPNMPTPATALVYPGQCLFEATNLSEGRGTTRPFEIVGAPFLDGYDWVAALTEMARKELPLPGVRFRPLSFRPTFHKFAGRSCGGVQLHVTDRAAFRPYATGIALIASAQRLAPAEFRWRTEPYEFVADPPAIDLLSGGGEVRRTVDANAPLGPLIASFAPFEREFAERRRPALLADYL